jgi:hypothetical protein
MSQAHKELAWWYIRQQIGWGLRKRYRVPKEVPPKLLALVRKLDAGEDNYSMRADNPSERDLLLPSISWEKDSDSA